MVTLFMATGKRFLMLFVGLTIGWGTQVHAQSTHLTAKSLGLGGGGTAFVDDYHANFINPANIMLGEGETPRTTIGIIGGLSANAGGPLANISVYNKYFTKGLTLTGTVANEALNQWFSTDALEMKSFTVQADFIPIGVSYRGGNWGVSAALRSRTMMNTAVNKGFAQLGIFGFDREVFGDGQAINFSTEAVSFFEASFGFSFKLVELESLFGFAENIKIYAGAAPKLLVGAHTSKVDFNSVLTLEGRGQNEIDEIRHDFAYSFEASGEISEQLREFYRARRNQQTTPEIGDYVDPVGKDVYGLKASGLGVDLGSTIEMDLNIPVVGAFFKGPERLRIGLSLTDLGSLSFDKAGRFSADEEFVWRGFDLNEERINEEFNGDRDAYINHVLEDSIATELYGSFAPEGDTKITPSLPSMLHFGSQLSLNKLSVSFDIARGFNNRGTNRRNFALSTGIEYDLLGFLPLRVGMRTGGYSSTSYSAGLGLEFRNFEFSVAGSAVKNSQSRGANLAGAWSGLVFKF